MGTDKMRKDEFDSGMDTFYNPIESRKFLKDGIYDKKREDNGMTRLHAVLITPLTGPLALFGHASAAGLTLWARYAANLPSPWTEVELDVLDVGNNVGVAVQSALNRRPDVLFGPYGSSGTLGVARASERVIWNHGGATSRLAWPAFPRVINVLSPASTYFAGVLQAVRAFDPDAKTVTLFHSTSGFGRDVAAGALTAATTLHFEVQSIPFEPSRAVAAVSTVPDGDILLVVGNFADELAVASILLTRSWRFAAFVGAGVEEVLAPLGNQRERLLGPAQWIATAAFTPDEGPDAAWFIAKYRDAVGVDPPYPAVQAFGAGLLYARCLRESGYSDDAAQLAAARHLVCTTLYGAFQLAPLSGLQSRHQILVVQWQQGCRRVVWPPEQAERPLLSPFLK
jgi:branched-chain amino acid transport system substrate-binding protein